MPEQKERGSQESELKLTERRWYYKDGKCIGSEPLASLSEKPEDWFTARKDADEYIDAESPVEEGIVDEGADEEKNEEYSGYRNPKDAKFKGIILSQEK